MKRLLVLLLCGMTVSACSTRNQVADQDQERAKLAQAKRLKARGGAPVRPLLDANGAPIERIAFQSGVSTVTVERLARQRGCTSGTGTGAGRITPAGPVEVYRMSCDDGKVFVAKCELRQCSAMPGPPAVAALR